jgi:PBP1b-binding outer membrane lipoprotein LpoB
MKYSKTVLTHTCLAIILMSCSQPVPNTPAPVVQPNQATEAPATPLLTPDKNLTIASIKRLLTSGDLKMQVGEELMLLGEVEMSDKSRISFDSIKDQLKIENLDPELLTINTTDRLVKALKAGLAEVRITPLANEKLSLVVKISIEAPPPAIDPNIALVELEIG